MRLLQGSSGSRAPISLQVFAQTCLVELVQVGFQIPKHEIRIVGQVLEIVEHVDEQILLAQFFRIGRNHAKLEVLPAQREITRPLVVVNQMVVIDLGQTKAKLVVVIAGG